MLRGVSLVGFALCAACGGSSDGPVDAGDPFIGGSVLTPGCGDVVHLGLGATPPVVAGGLVGSDPAPWQVHLGIAADPRTSMVVTWRTADETTERTAVIIDGLRYTGVTWQHRDRHGDVYRMHEVHLCDLAADTAYTYRIDGDPTPETGTFRTAPDLTADPGAEVVAVAFGDTRGDDGADTLAMVLAQVEQRAPDLLLFTGDAVVNGATQDQWDRFYGASEALFRRVPMIAAVGNHEAGDIVAYSEWALPGDEQWFSLDYGAAHLVALDDSPTQYPDWERHGADFLQSDLPGARPGAWRIVMHHQAMYSAANGHADNTILRDGWGQILDDNNVDLVLAGHDHNYERTKPLRGGLPRTPGAGTTYIVTAGGGATLVDAGTAFWTAVSRKDYHFVLLHIRADRIAGQAIDASGVAFDEFELSAAARHNAMLDSR